MSETINEIQKLGPGVQLDKLIAEARGEPEPGYMPDWADIFGSCFDNNPIRSEKGNWICLMYYETGDNPFWRPDYFSENLLKADKLLDEISGEYAYSILSVPAYSSFLRGITILLKKGSVHPPSWKDRYYDIIISSQTKAHAICLAYLTAKYLEKL